MATLAAVGSVVEIAQNGITAASDGLVLLDSVVEKLIPWKEFDKVLHELKESKNQYSMTAAELVGEVETLLLNAKDSHQASVTSVLTWCRSAVTLLPHYLKLFAKVKESQVAAAQKIVLLNVLKDGERKITVAIDKLGAASTSFNEASGKLTTLKDQLHTDFKVGSSYYEQSVDKLRTEAYAGALAGAVLGPIGLAISYSIAAGIVEGEMIPNLQKAFEETEQSFQKTLTNVKAAKSKIVKAKEALAKEITAMSEISSTIESTATFAEIWAEIPEAMFVPLKEETNNLVMQCQNYIDERSN